MTPNVSLHQMPMEENKTEYKEQINNMEAVRSGVEWVSN